MPNNDNIIELGKYLPHGSKKEIARLSGISQATICKYFQGATVRPDIGIKIIKASEQFVKMANDTKAETERYIKSLTQAMK